MTIDTLLLNADYRPLTILGWQRAVTLVMADKAHCLEDYASRTIRSPSEAMPWPAVVVLRRYVAVRPRIKMSRTNILARDGYQCGYCGVRPVSAGGRPILSELSIDHVVPRAQAMDGWVSLKGGRRVSVTSWENVVTACMPCNLSKADRTPAQAGLVLRHQPVRPKAWDVLRIAFTRVHVPDEWKAYLPQDSGWRDYWDAEIG